MEGNDASGKVNFDLVAEIVSSYVRHNMIAADELPRLISEVHRALESLGRSASRREEPPKPAVPIRRSVAEEYVVCLECGFRSHALRRHLREKHGLTADEYRARWNLRPDHPLTAPRYSARRAAIAKAIGFGRAAGPSEPSPPPPEQTPSAGEAAPEHTTRRGRPRPRRGRKVG